MKYEKKLWDYNAEVNRVIDGDSVELIIDEGFRHSWRVSCRMKHINADELRSTDPLTRAMAQKARDYLIKRLPKGTSVYIISRNLDKYGRPEIDLFLNDTNINQEMLDKGLAVPFM